MRGWCDVPPFDHLLLTGQGAFQGAPPLLRRCKPRNGVLVSHQRGLLLEKESFKQTERLFLRGGIDHLLQLLAGHQKGNAGCGVPAPCALKVPASLAEGDQTNKTGCSP